MDVMPSVHIGSKILVIGAGIIGLLWSSLLHFLGHREVYVVQSSPTRRKTFNNLGLGYQAMSWDDIDMYTKNGHGWKFDMCIDSSGNAQAMEKAVTLLRPRGALVIFGVSDPMKTFTVSPFDLYKKELTIIGTAINTHTSFQKAVDLLQAMGERYFTVEKLNMAIFSLDDYQNGLKQLNDRVYTKILFEG